MPQSPFGTTPDILRADAVILEGLLTVHKVRHGAIGECPVNRPCETAEGINQELQAVLARLAREQLSGRDSSG